MPKVPNNELYRSQMVVAAALILATGLADVLLRTLSLNSNTPILAAVSSVFPNVLDNVIAGLCAFVGVAWYFRGHSLPSYPASNGQIAQADTLSVNCTLVPEPQEVSALERSKWSSKSIDDFVSSVSLSTVSHISIMSITGDVTIKNFCNAIARAKDQKRLPQEISVKVLLRADSSSDTRRTNRKEEAVAALRALHLSIEGFLYEIRTYSSVSPLHCLIMEHTDHTFSAYLSFYDWRATGPNVRESANPMVAVFSHVQEQEPLLSVFLSWFRHCWGKHKVHTLIFDFDDTLFETTAAQVKGWVAAIRSVLGDGIISTGDLKADVAEALASESSLTEKLTTIFLDEQRESNIFDRLLATKMSPEKLEAIRRVRLAVRDFETAETAAPIADIAGPIRELQAEYQLAIISATSEKTINTVLRRYNLDVFPYVFGKEAVSAWKNIETKSPTFVRISNMIGVPFERMIFIGDSDSDFRTARQLGLKFIESRFNAMKHGRDSLVTSRQPEDETYAVGGKEKVELKSVIARIDGSMG